MRIRLVRSLTVCLGDQPLTAVAIGSRKARTLLALAAVERGSRLSIDRIIDVLWPATRPRHPVENVATLVSRLRSTLGSAAIVGGRTGYRLGDAVRIDLSECAKLTAEAEAQLASGMAATALAAAASAVEQLAGEVLEDEPDAVWAAPARRTHVELMRRARRVSAEAALRVGAVHAARAVAEDAVAADALDEPAYRALMRAHAAAGEPVRALAAYQRLRTTLADELGVDPAPVTRDLYVAILRHRAR